MSTLAVDIGGTRFRLAIFDGDRIVERVSHATDRSGGRDWMLGKIAEIIDGLEDMPCYRSLRHWLWRPCGFRKSASGAFYACIRVERLRSAALPRAS